MLIPLGLCILLFSNVRGTRTTRFLYWDTLSREMTVENSEPFTLENRAKVHKAIDSVGVSQNERRRENQDLAKKKGLSHVLLFFIYKSKSASGCLPTNGQVGTLLIGEDVQSVTHIAGATRYLAPLHARVRSRVVAHVRVPWFEPLRPQI